MLEARLCDREAVVDTLAPNCADGARGWRCDAIGVTLAPPLPLPAARPSQLRLVMPGANAELDVTLPAQRRMLHLTEADVLILPSGVQHSIRCAPETTTVLIELDDCACPPLSDMHHGPRTFLGPDAFLTATAQMLQTRFETAWHPGRDDLMALARVIAVHLRHMPHARGREIPSIRGLPRHKLRVVKTMIDERLCGNLEVRQLSDAIGMSPAHFSRVFKRATGYSPYVYVTLRRVRRARELMLTSDASTMDAAVAVGLRTSRRLAAMSERFIVAPLPRPGPARRPNLADAMVKAG